jgi:2-polyprenyl-3-methyl-5-hydroxy-6-metoxy-1,4-benzoquinol methylase
MKIDWYEDRRLRLLASEAGSGSVLDVGYAQLPNPYLSRPDREVTGVDLNPPPANCAYEQVVQGDVMECRSQFGANAFDTVIAGEVIEHVENPYSLLREIRSIIRPDGRLVLSTPNPLGFPVIVAELLRSHRYFYSADHRHYFLPRWVERMLAQTGFKLVRIRPVGLWVPYLHLPWSPNWLSYQLVYVSQVW